MLTNPIALAALSLLVLPVLIHMLARLKGRRVLFPTLRYLNATASHRLTLRRIDRWPLLAARLLACALLILAIAGPVLLNESYDNRAVVLMIDASMSMNAEPVREQVTRRASEVIRSLGAKDIAAIAQCDTRVKLLCEFTSDRALLEAALEAYSPAHGEIDFNAALSWANELLATRDARRELIILSDLQATNVQSLEPTSLDRIDLQVIRLNSGPRVNARLGPVVVRPQAQALDVSSTVVIDEGDRTIIAPVKFKLARHASNTSAAHSGTNATLSAELLSRELFAGVIRTNRADEFDADDDRFFIARVAGTGEVLIIQPRFTSNDQAAFIEKAIQANAVDGSNITSTERSERFPASADAMAGKRVVIAPIESLDKANIAVVSEYVRRGGSLILTVSGAANLSSALETISGPDGLFQSISLGPINPLDRVALSLPARSSDLPADARSRSFEADVAAAFASVRLHAAHSINAAGAEALLRYSNGEPAIIQTTSGAGRVLISGFGFSSRDTSLALSPVFPFFVEWLIEAGGAGQVTEDFVAGQPAVRMLGGAEKLTKIYSSRGPVRDDMMINQAREPDEPGVYEVERSAGKFFFSLNPPVAESSLTRASEADLLERVSINSAEQPGSEKYKRDALEKGDELWRVFAIAALLLSVFELLYSNLKTVNSGE